MSELQELRARLAQMLLDPFMLSLPEAALDEALRRALEQVNLLLETPAALAGLDGASTGSLPAYARPALMDCAEAFALSSGLGSRLLGFDGSLAGGPALLAYAEARKDAAEAALEQLRLYLLQSSTARAGFCWPWQEEWV
mgnify:FL=1